MATVIGIDFETTGLLPEEDRIIEVGAALVEWETGNPLMLMSSFVRPELPIPEEITKITGITDEQVDVYGISEKAAFSELHDLMSYADYAMAFNGSRFDQLFYLAACRRLEVEPSGVFWLDASCDVKYPEAIKTRNLRHLASEHSFLNPFAHRAVFDVLTMFRVAREYNLDEIITRAHEPIVYLQACVSFAENQKAKDRSYRWHPPSKVWWKGLKQSDAEIEVVECGFQTRRLERAPE